MSIKVHLYSNLQQYANGCDIVEVKGKTVGECLNDLITQYPQIRPYLFDEDGKVSTGVFVSINLESPYSEKLTTPLEINDNLYLILIVAGG
jgi:molybdopterin converting factor small subunit